MGYLCHKFQKTRSVLTTACLLLLLVSNSGAITYKFGALVDSEESGSAVRYAVEYVNDKELLGPGHVLDYIINITVSIDPFKNMQTLCQQAEQGVMAFMGPMTSTSTKAVCPLSKALNIPVMSPISTDPLLGLKVKCPTLLRMMAPDSVQSLALIALVEKYGWSKMAILTSDTDYGVNGLVKFQAEASQRNWKVTSVLRFPAGGIDGYLDVRPQLTIIRESGVRVIILNCLARFGLPVLEQAKELGMTGPGWAWLVTDGITSYDYGNDGGPDNSVPSHMIGLLGTRPATGNGILWEEVSSAWALLDPIEYLGAGDAITAYDEYLIDTVLTFTYALRNMLDGGYTGLDSPSLTCNSQDQKSWSYGNAFLSYLGKVDADGVASRIRFNTDLSPQMPIFDVVNLHETGWVQVGNWSENHGLSMHHGEVYFSGRRQYVNDYISSLTGRTVSAVTISEPPFVIIVNKSLKPGDTAQHGDVEGYCLDLMDKLAEEIGFNYTMYLVADGKFGNKDQDTRQWNGMLKDLVDRKVDIAISDLTINTVREEDVDFTKPYMDTGMTFLMKLEEAEKPDPWRFMEPFSDEVWLYILLTSFLVAVCVSLVNKFSPYDHHGGFVYVDAVNANADCLFKEYKKHKKLKLTAIAQLNLSNAIWFSVASLLQQGGDVYPKAISGRLTSVVWWFTVMIVIATYTANLAAFLTASRTQTHITSIGDLSSQTKVKYGTVASSNPELFFSDSKISMYKEMGETMKTRNTYLPNTAEGIERARAGDYAFIWDKAVLDYDVQRKPCNTLETVGDLFGKIGYGFALQKNSPYKEELSTYILQLRESGFMEELEDKWYRQRGECNGKSHADAQKDEMIAMAGGMLTVDHMLGVFYIIYGGQLLSIIILLIEWIVACYSAVDQSDPLSPKSFGEAVKRRMHQVRDDFVQQWLPVLPHCCPFQCQKPPELYAERGSLSKNDPFDTKALDEGYHEMNGSLGESDSQKDNFISESGRNVNKKEKHKSLTSENKNSPRANGSVGKWFSPAATIAGPSLSFAAMSGDQQENLHRPNSSKCSAQGNKNILNHNKPSFIHIPGNGNLHRAISVSELTLSQSSSQDNLLSNIEKIDGTNHQKFNGYQPNEIDMNLTSIPPILSNARTKTFSDRRVTVHSPIPEHDTLSKNCATSLEDTNTVLNETGAENFSRESIDTNSLCISSCLPNNNVTYEYCGALNTDQ